MKAADIKVGEVYAAHRYGSGSYESRAASLVRVIEPTRTALDWRKRSQPGWLVELVEGKRAGERFTIPSRNFFHDEAKERAEREQRTKRQSERAALMAEGERLAGLLGGIARSAVGGFTISLTAEKARELAARLERESA